MGVFVRKGWTIGGLLGACLFAATAAATVVPPTPEQIAIMHKREALENHARNAFADIGLIEKLTDWRRHWGFVLVGKEGSSAAPRLLIKDEFGWYEMRPGQTRRLPLALGHELNRLLNSSEAWAEDAYHSKARCSGTPRPFIIRHAGRDLFGRLGCGPEGIAARAARIAETLRIPPGRPETTPLRAQRQPPPGASREYHEATSEITERLFDMAAAWERKTLAGFVEPYAEDVIVERPEGVLRGRKAVIQWAKFAQDWDSPYDGSRFVMHQAAMNVQDARVVFYETHEFRWEQDGRPVRQTFSTMWRKTRGVWQIAHERVSEIKPVTERRPVSGS